MGYFITCPVEGCGKVYQDWNALRTKDEVEKSFRSHLTGKHCLKGEAFKEAYLCAKREQT